VVVLDDRDRQVLAALALTSMGTVKLARRVEVCPMTIRRRVRLLASAVWCSPTPEVFSVTAAGLAALGPEAPQKPAPWVKVEAVSAANAKDVASAVRMIAPRPAQRAQFNGRGQRCGGRCVSASSSRSMHFLRG